MSYCNAQQTHATHHKQSYRDTHHTVDAYTAVQPCVLAWIARMEMQQQYVSVKLNIPGPVWESQWSGAVRNWLGKKHCAQDTHAHKYLHPYTQPEDQLPTAMLQQRDASCISDHLSQTLVWGTRDALYKSGKEVRTSSFLITCASQLLSPLFYGGRSKDFVRF